jgi:hypothetical protein
MNNKFIITPIKLTDIKLYYNSKNHGNIPDDCNEILELFTINKWIGLFKEEFIKFTIDDPKHVRLIKLANKVGSITGKIPNLFLEDMREIFDMYGDNVFDDNVFFVKVNNVSLRHGRHGIGPYYNLQSIIESSVTCNKEHSFINQDTNKLDIYLITWEKIDPLNEFRVFVYNNKITTISQKYIQTILYDDKIIDNIQNMLTTIVNYFNNTIKNKVTWVSNYTYDFAIIENNPYFIKMKSFGKEYGTDSLLFDWKLDENILCNACDNTIEFRYTA